MRFAIAAGALCALALAHAQAQQPYPAKPIRGVMSLGGGGSAETALRSIALKFAESTGQTILVDAQGGAGGAIGAEMVMRAAPDGYTLLFGTTSAIVLRRFLVKNTSYDALRDFTPVIQVGETVSAVVAGPSVPGDTLPQLLEYVKKNPGKISYGSTGIGTTHHLSGELIQMLTGVKWVHVPYKNGAQAALDAVSGRIDVMFTTLGTLQPQIAPGKLRLLGINNGKRFHRAANVPTIAEQIPGYDRPPSWVGFLGPANLPAPIVKRLYDELNKAILHPDTVERLVQVGILADTQSPAEFAAFIKYNIEAAAKLMKAAGIEPE